MIKSEYWGKVGFKNLKRLKSIFRSFEIAIEFIFTRVSMFLSQNYIWRLLKTGASCWRLNWCELGWDCASLFLAPILGPLFWSKSKSFEQIPRKIVVHLIEIRGRANRPLLLSLPLSSIIHSLFFQMENCPFFHCFFSFFTSLLHLKIDCFNFFVWKYSKSTNIKTGIRLTENDAKFKQIQKRIGTFVLLFSHWFIEFP